MHHLFIKINKMYNIKFQSLTQNIYCLISTINKYFFFKNKQMTNVINLSVIVLNISETTKNKLEALTNAI